MGEVIGTCQGASDRPSTSLLLPVAAMVWACLGNDTVVLCFLCVFDASRLPAVARFAAQRRPRSLLL